MNTHDIELPPLPEPFTYTRPGVLEGPLFHNRHMQAYAISAIEADRKRRGAAPLQAIGNLLAEAMEAATANGADSRSMPDEYVEVAAWLCGVSPQPAKPMKLCDCERGHNGMGMVGRECDCPSNNSQPAELATFRAACNQSLQPSGPVKGPSDEDIIQLFVDMVQKDEIGRPVMDISMKEAIEVSRELLRRYGNTANPRPTDDELLDQALRERDAASEMADKLADAIAKHLGIDIGEHTSSNHPWYRALDAIEASKPVEPVNPPTREQIREVFLANGFTIKPGHDDLKPYVYKAARALLARYGQPAP